MRQTPSTSDPERTLAVQIDPELTRLWQDYLKGRSPQLERTSETERRAQRWETLSKAQMPTLSEREEELGDLTLGQPLGQGGMGVVYLAWQQSIGREVAVKMLREETRDAATSQKLLDEARITASLAHPNVIPVHALGVSPSGDPLYVMKRVEGVS